MNRPGVAVVVVTYQSKGTIDDALSVGRAAVEAGVARYVVVDNDSTDGTVELVRQRHPWVTLIENGVNVGFGRGCNLGAAEAQTPYLLFLNPDAVMELPALRTLVDFLDTHPAAGIVGPAIEGDEGEWHHAGGVPRPWKMIGSAVGWRRGDPERRTVVGGEPPFQTDWVSGAALMIRRDLFEKLGGFDPRFFLYFDETDLCRRAINEGAEIWAVGEAVIGHVGGHSAEQEKQGMFHGCIAEHFFASRFYYLVKHHGWPAAVAAEAAELLGTAARDVARPLLRRPARCDLRHRLQGPVFRLPPRVTERDCPARVRSGG